LAETAATLALAAPHRSPPSLYVMGVAIPARPGLISKIYQATQGWGQSKNRDLLWTRCHSSAWNCIFWQSGQTSYHISIELTKSLYSLLHCLDSVFTLARWYRIPATGNLTRKAVHSPVREHQTRSPEEYPGRLSSLVVRFLRSLLEIVST
jgi:hypothetical protein